MKNLSTKQCGVLFAFFLSLLFVPSLSFAAATWTHHWDLNGNTHDSIGTANLTDHGGPTYTTPFLAGGMAYVGNGTTYSAITGLVPAGDGSFSTSMWFKYNGSDGVKGGWTFDGAGAPDRATVYYGGVPGVDICFNGSCHVFPQGSSDCSNINDGSPHMVSYGYDGTAHSLEVFCDDVSLGSYSITLNTNTDLRGGVNVEDNNSNSGDALFQDEWFGTGVVSQAQVDALYVYVPGGGGGGGAIAGSFLTPSSTFSGPDFSSWALQLTLPASGTYYGQVEYQHSTHFDNTLAFFTDPFALTTAVSSTVRWPVFKRNTLYGYQNNSTSTQWSAILLFSTSTTFNATSDEITFTIDPNATAAPSSTGSDIAGPWFWGGIANNPSWTSPNASTSQRLSAQCVPANDWTDIGGGLSFGFCSAINWLFVPTNDVKQTFYQSYQNVNGDFPLNIVNGTLGNIVAAAQSPTLTQDQALSLNIWGMNLPVLSSSSLSQFVGSSSKDLIFSTEDAAAWAGIGWTMVKIIF